MIAVRRRKREACSLLLAALAREAGKELAVLGHGHGAGRALSSLAALGGGGGAGRNGLLSSAGGLSTSSLAASSGESVNGTSTLGGGLGGSFLGGGLLSLNAGSTGGLGLLGLGTSEGHSLGVSLFELPLAAGVGEDTLADLVLSSGKRGHVNLLGGGGGANLLVTEGLDGGLELVVSVEVGGVASGMEGLLELGLEGVDDKAALNTSVGGEDLGGVDSAELKGPSGDDDNLALEVENVDLGELALVLGDGGLGSAKVCGHTPTVATWMCPDHPRVEC